jgi:alpha/beta superfamily hydrolase
MPRRIETLFLNGPEGRLEALIEEPEVQAPVEAAVLCHPHPQFGGTMHNKVVYRMARGLRNSGCVVLRFNFRGVNLSQGEYANGLGETEDARVAMREMQARYPDLPLLAAGFSFGSRVALRLTSQEASIRRVLAVGFPTRWEDREFVYAVGVPKFFVQSTNDQFGPRTAMAEFFESVGEPKELHWIEAADHFFKDNLDGFEKVIENIGRAR